MSEQHKSLWRWWPLLVGAIAGLLGNWWDGGIDFTWRWFAVWAGGLVVIAVVFYTGERYFERRKQGQP